MLNFFWVCALLSFPITSFPFFGISSTVSPLSFAFILIILILLFFKPKIRLNHINLDDSLVLFFYGLYILLTSIFISLGTANSFSYIATGFFSFLVGFFFYFVFSAMNLSKSEVYKTEKYILIGMSLSVAYAVIQWFTHTKAQNFLPIVTFLDHLMINADNLSSERFQGFAREPAWLADQLLLISLPLTLSMILSKRSYGRLMILNKVTPIRLEYLYFCIATLGILIAGSRTGFLGLFILILISLFYALGNNDRLSYKIFKTFFYIFWIFLGVVFLINSPYSYGVLKSAFASDNFIVFANQSSFAPRLSLWLSSIDVIKDNFISGIGINQFGNFYPSYVQDWALNSTEVLGFVELNDINSKQLFLKVFLEGGVIGFFIFVYFLSRHFVGFSSHRSRAKYLRVLIFFSLIIVSFESDTYALPNLWFALGFCKLIKD